MASPDRTHHRPPTTDTNTAAVIQHALADLAHRRTLPWPEDAATTVHLLRSLQEEIHTRLPTAITQARHQHYSWAEIGDLLATTRAAAWNRYARPQANPKG